MNDFKGFTWHKFWLKSSRGTDITEYMFLDPDLDPQQELEYWIDREGAHLTSIEYGRKKLSIPPKKVLSNLCIKLGRRVAEDARKLREWEKMLYDTFGHPGG